MATVGSEIRAWSFGFRARVVVTVSVDWPECNVAKAEESAGRAIFEAIRGLPESELAPFYWSIESPSP